MNTIGELGRGFGELLRAASLCGLLAMLALASFAPAVRAAEPPWSPVEVSVFETPSGFGFGNDYGIPFFTNDRDVPFQGGGGKVGCDDACTAVSWIPVFARASAKPQGDWSVIVRPDKAAQWAYKGKPVYNYFASQDIQEVSEVVGRDAHWHKLVP